MVTRYGSVNEGEVEEETIFEKLITPSRKKMIIGIFLSTSSGILFTANNFIVNQFEVVVSDALVVRCVIQAIIFSCIIYWNGDRMLPWNWALPFLQGLTGSISLITCLASISFMPVPDALCIIFTCPVITIIFSAIILGDKLNCVKCVSGLLLLLGVVLVTQPPVIFHTVVPAGLASFFTLPSAHDNLYFIGAALAGTGCVTGGLTRVLITKCGEGVSIPLLVNWSALWGIIFSAGFCFFQPGSSILSPSITTISARDWLIFLGLALSGLMAFTLMTQALKLISPNLVSAFRALELVLAFAVQAILTGEAPDTLPCLGGSLILAGVLALTFQEKILNWFSFSQISEISPENQAATEQTEYSRLVEEGRG